MAVSACAVWGPTYQPSASQSLESLISGSRRVEFDGFPSQLVLPKLTYMSKQHKLNEFAQSALCLNWSHLSKHLTTVMAHLCA